MPLPTPILERANSLYDIFQDVLDPPETREQYIHVIETEMANCALYGVSYNEIAIWERLAAAYTSFLAAHPRLRLAAKREAYNVLACTTLVPLDQLMKRPREALTARQIRALLTEHLVWRVTHEA